MMLNNFTIHDAINALSNLTSLEEVYIKKRKLFPEDIALLKAFKNVKRLELKLEEVNELLADLAELPALISLTIDSPTLSELAVFMIPNTKFSQADLSILAKLINLKKLNLSSNENIAQINFSALADLKDLKELDLSYCKLKQIPPILSAFTNLEILNLHGNKISNADFSAIATLKNLKKLDLSGCELKQIPPILSTLTQLEILNLDRNKISNADFSVLATLKNLKKLYLSSCGLKQIPPILSTLTQLKVLILYSKKDMAQVDVSLLAKLEDLKELDLSYCNLTQLPPSLVALTHLEVLNLGWHEYMVEEDFSLLAKLKNLKGLHSSSYHLTQLPASLAALNQLEILDLTSEESILDTSYVGSDETQTDLSTFQNLKILHCPKRVFPIGLGTLHKLEELSLEMIDLDQENISQIATLHNLKTLRLSDCVFNPFTPEEVRNIALLLQSKQEENIQIVLSMQYPSIIKNLLNEYETLYEGLYEYVVKQESLASVCTTINSCDRIKISWHEQEISLFKSVTYLSLRENPFAESFFTHITKLISLEELDLSENDLSKMDLSCLKSCQKLKKLNLSKCRLTAIPEVLKHLGSLEEIYFRTKNNFSKDYYYNNLKNADLSLLFQLKNLKKLDFSGAIPEDYFYGFAKIEELQARGIKVIY